jgi:hypothetical protein
MTSIGGAPVIKPFPLIVAGLAAQRAAQAVSVDKITEPLRQRVLLWSVSDDQTPEQYERRAKVYNLVRCPHCTGFWLSAVALTGVTLAGRRRGLARFGVEWLAVASIQTLLTAAWAMFSDVAHYAEVETTLAGRELLKQQQAQITPP